MRTLKALKLSVKDARDFAAAMQQQRGRLYRNVVVRLQTDANARRADLVEALDWLRQQVGENDVGMLYLSGHGANDNHGRYQFATTDANIDRLVETGLPDSVITRALANLRGRAILFMDTCRAGALAESMPNISRETARFANTLAAPEHSVVVFAASTGRQDSIEIDDLGNGVFTKAALDGLGGAARLPSFDAVTSHSLGPYLVRSVSRQSGNTQTPVALIPDAMPDRILTALE